MKKITLKTVAKISSVVLLLAIFLCSASAASPAPISRGVEILAKDIRMLKSGLLYSDITFSPRDFEQALGVARVGKITLSSLPLPTDGTLFLGDKKLEAGDTIDRKNISAMKFVPASSDVRESSFSFYSNHGAHEIVCSVFVLESVNFAPTTGLANDSSLSVKTSKDISYFGTLSAYDPENDPLSYEIITPPKNGSLSLDNSHSGDYRYTPNAGFSGKDSFSYTVHDRYGNYSDITTVNIKINKSAASLTFADMKGHWAEGAAASAVQKGIMNSKVVGGQAYFSPDTEVSRAEFLAMVMKARGINALSAGDATIFTDDEDIPTELKGYVTEALSRGYIHGSYTSSGIFFNPNSTITRAEAAVMINNILDAATPTVLPTFSDINDVPAWARGALYSLSSLGIFKGTGAGNISANATINRAQAAKIIESLSEIK